MYRPQSFLWKIYLSLEWTKSKVKLKIGTTLLIAYVFADPDPDDLGGVHHQGEDGEDHPQRGGGVHEWGDSHVLIPHLPWGHLQGGGRYHRRRINTEENAKVVAAFWGTDFVQFFTALAVLH